MKVDSEIICRKEPYGTVCEWKGDQRHGTATIGGRALYRILKVKYVNHPVVFKFGGLRLRTLGTVFDGVGMGSDRYYVKLDNPHSQLYALYRENAERLIRFILRCEAAVRAFMLQPVEGVEMPFTKGLATKLL